MTIRYPELIEETFEEFPSDGMDVLIVTEIAAWRVRDWHRHFSAPSGAIRWCEWEGLVAGSPVWYEVSRTVSERKWTIKSVPSKGQGFIQYMENRSPLYYEPGENQLTALKLAEWWNESFPSTIGWVPVPGPEDVKNGAP